VTLGIRKLSLCYVQALFRLHYAGCLNLASRPQPVGLMASIRANTLEEHHEPNLVFPSPEPFSLTGLRPHTLGNGSAFRGSAGEKGDWIDEGEVSA
jgi:hypothetical protein